MQRLWKESVLMMEEQLSAAEPCWATGSVVVESVGRWPCNDCLGDDRGDERPGALKNSRGGKDVSCGGDRSCGALVGRVGTAAAWNSLVLAGRGAPRHLFSDSPTF